MPKADGVASVARGGAEPRARAFTGQDKVRRTAVADVSFELFAGETLGIVGESGSGKTTIARIVVGLQEPDAGSVFLRGRDWAALSDAEQRAERKRIQYVHQDPLSSFDPRYTVEPGDRGSARVAGRADMNAGNG